MADYRVGDLVEKCTGDYHWRGEIRAVFSMHEGGPLRVVVAHPIPHTAGRGYVLHIYAQSNLRHVNHEVAENHT
jgi:hypothetical protein